MDGISIGNYRDTYLNEVIASGILRESDEQRLLADLCEDGASSELRPVKNAAEEPKQCM